MQSPMRFLNLQSPALPCVSNVVYLQGAMASLNSLPAKYRHKFDRRLELFSRPEHRVNTQVLTWLPHMAFSTTTLDKYMMQGMDYLACCVAHNIAAIPCSFKSLTTYFASYFMRGHTTRTFNSISTRLKWFVVHVCHSQWLDERNRDDFEAFLRARRALSKLDESVIDKALPLTTRHLRLIYSVHDASSTYDVQVLTVWVLAHAAIQRLGEIVNGTAKVENLELFSSRVGKFYAFYYLSGNRPKAHKTKQAPYAMVSEKSNPFAFNIIAYFMKVVHSQSHAKDYLFPKITSSRLIDRFRFMTSTSAITRLREWLDMCGVPCSKDYSGHSARRGGFVDRVHVPIGFTQIQGHWAPGSLTAHLEYDVYDVKRRMDFF